MSKRAALTQKRAAEKLGISASWLRELTKREVVSRNDDGSYPWPEVKHEFDRFQAADEEARAAGFGTSSYDEARARKVAAQARLAELEVARIEAELVPLDSVREVVRQVAERLMGALKNVPGSWAPLLAGKESPRDVARVLREMIAELAEDLNGLMDDLVDPSDLPQLGD